MLNDELLDTVILELHKYKQTPQAITYILAKLDEKRDLAEPITRKLDSEGITRSRHSRVMLTAKGVQVAESGGWFAYLKNKAAFGTDDLVHKTHRKRSKRGFLSKVRESSLAFFSLF